MENMFFSYRLFNCLRKELSISTGWIWNHPEKILGSKSKGAILMPEIEAEIVCCAIELSKVPIDEIIKFIKSDLNLRNVVVHAGLIVEFR